MKKYYKFLSLILSALIAVVTLSPLAFAQTSQPATTWKVISGNAITPVNNRSVQIGDLTVTGTCTGCGGGGVSDLQGAYNGGPSIVTGANGPVQIVTGTTAYGSGLSIFANLKDSVSSFTETVIGDAFSSPIRLDLDKVIDDGAITFVGATQVDFGVDLFTAGVVSPGQNSNNPGTIVFIKNTDISPTDEGAYFVIAVSGGGNNIATLATITGGVPAFTATTGTATAANLLRQWGYTTDLYSSEGSMNHQLFVSVDGGTVTNMVDVLARPTYGTVSSSFVSITNQNTSGSTNVPLIKMSQNGLAPHMRFVDATTPSIYTIGDFWREAGDERLHYYDSSSIDNTIAYLTDITTTSSFADNLFRVYDDGDNTKQFALQVSQVTTGTTRAFTVPDGDGIFSTTAGGSQNISTGGATYAYTTGFADTVYGIAAGTSLTSGNRNTLIGTSAGGTLTTQSDVTAIGNGTLSSYTGNSSVAVGSNAGLFTTSGLNLVLIGAGADTTAGTENYGIAIGQGAKITASNQAVLGSHSAPINDFYFGSGSDNDNTTPATYVTFHGTNAFNQTDVIGSGLIFATGKSTGTATPGDIKFQTGNATLSGATQQTLKDRITIGSGITTLWGDGSNAQDLRFYNAANTQYVGFKATNGAITSVVWTLPATDGALNQTLVTNGAGVLSWATPTGATTFADNVFRVYDNGDNTKNVALEVSAVSTATTRTFKVPNANGMLPAYNSSTISLITGEDGGGNVLAPVGTGTLNVHYGVFSGLGGMTTAYSNTAMGVNAGGFLTTGYENVNIGSHAGQNLGTGYRNVVIGAEASLALSATNSVVIIGAYAGGTGATADPAAGTVAIGDSALGTAQATAVNNVAIGYQAGINVSTGDDMVLIGYTAGQGITTGSNSIAIGRGILSGTFTGTNVIGIGRLALQSATSASDIIAIGTNAADIITSGTNSVAIGQDALGTATTTSDNVAIGHSALSLATGSGNTSIGASSSTTLTTGSRNVAIGSNAGVASATLSDTIALGAYAAPTASNQMVIGSATAPITDSYLGKGVTDPTPANTALNASGGNGTNIVGASFTLAGGKATGNAVGGSVLIETSTVGASGSTLQTLGLVAEFDYLKSSIFSGRVQEKQGANVTAANDLTLGFGGNFFVVTGNTTINGIAIANWQEGSEITLMFTGTPTVKHNTAPSAGFAKIKLDGEADLAAANGTLIELVYDGTDWREVGPPSFTGA